jgi:hypothetical protein
VDAILNNLKDPSWWFTGIFFLLIPWFVPRALRYFKNVAARLIQIKSLSQIRASLRIQRIRKNRQTLIASRNAMLVTAAIGRSNAYYAVFLLVVCSYFLGFFFFTVTRGNIHLATALILSFPIYGFEIAWLTNSDKAKELIAAYGKTSKSTYRRLGKSPEPII